MHLRLLLVSHAATAAMRRGDFPADDALDQRGIAATQAWRARLPSAPAAAVLRSPAACAEQTARLLGLAAETAPALDEADYGRWRGQRLSDIAAGEPDALARWLGEPDAAPHGGESVIAVIDRVGTWLDGLAGSSGTVVAITHASIMRAAMVHALGAPADAYFRIEIAPLSLLELRRSNRGWTWTATAPDADAAQG